MRPTAVVADEAYTMICLKTLKKFAKNICKLIGPGSVGDTATGYELDGPGIESRWRRDYPHLSRPALGPTHPPIKWVPGLSWGLQSGWGVALTPHPSSGVVKKEYSYTSTPPMRHTACIEPQCPYSIAIPLLPLWTVRSVQSLSACTV